MSVLTGGARDLSPRHQTLRSAIGWSYELLSAQEQAVFRRMGIFSGVFGLAAAEAVCADIATDVIETLESLATKSLIKASPQDADLPYFYLLETVREFALEQLSEAGEYDAVQAVHAGHYARVSENLCSTCLNHEEFGAASIELENFRSALHFYQAQPNATDSEVWLAGNVIHLCTRVGQRASARHYGEVTLRRDSASVSDRSRAVLLAFCGRNALESADLETARDYLQDMYALMMKPDFPHDIVYIKGLDLYAVGVLRNRPTEAIVMLSELVELCEHYPDQAINHWMVAVQIDLADAYDRSGQRDKAVALRRKLLPLAGTLGNGTLYGLLLASHAIDLIHDLKYDEAQTILKSALTATTRSRDFVNQIAQFYYLTYVQARLHHVAEAEDTLAKLMSAIRNFDGLGSPRAAMSGAQFVIALERGDYAAALEVLRGYAGLEDPAKYVNVFYDWLINALDLALATLPPIQGARIYGRWVEHVEHSGIGVIYRLNVPFHLQRRQQLEAALDADTFAAAVQSGCSLSRMEILAMFDMLAEDV